MAHSPPLLTFMILFRTLSNFKRAWQLSRLLAAAEKAETSPEEAFRLHLKDAVHEAFNLDRRLNRLEKQIRGLAHQTLQQVSASTESVETALLRGLADLQIKEATAMDKVRGSLAEFQPKLTDINSTLTAIRDFLSSQQQEVRRWKEGYDFALLRNYFIQMIQALDEADEKVASLKKDNGNLAHLNDLEFVRDAFRFALDACGLEHHIPQVGSKFDSSTRDCEAIERVPAPGPDNHQSIAEVVRPCYRLHVSDSSVRVVRPAHVVVQIWEDKA